jgi:hypothetical protein
MSVIIYRTPIYLAASYYSDMCEAGGGGGGRTRDC